MINRLGVLSLSLVVLASCEDGTFPTDADNALLHYRASRADFTVNTTDDLDDGVCDDSHCSLREAINAANAKSGKDLIGFRIPGGGVHTIQPLAPLPTIVDPVTIDGYTQPGASPNRMKIGSGSNARLNIELDGSNAGAPFVHGLYITGGESTVRGLVINRFSSGAIALRDNGGNSVSGNFLGTDVSGTKALGNHYGVHIFLSADNLIGGELPRDVNVISGNTGAGVWLEDSGATGNTLQGNLIGTASDAISPLGNLGDGVIFTRGGDVVGASGNTVGGPDGTGNTIAYSGRTGVFVQQGSYQNTVLSNSIYANGTRPEWDTELGIDLLDPFGVTPNDIGDADTGPNNKQNYPAISSVNSRAIEGTLNSTPNSRFTIQFFGNDQCDPSGYGEGQRYLGSQEVITDASGDVTFSHPLSGHSSRSMGQFVTATATDAEGNTSEFSECVRSTGQQHTGRRFRH